MMKSMRIVLLAAAMIMACGASHAQFRLGLRAGIAVNELHLSEKSLNSNNRTGFTGGLTTEFTVPIVGIGLDASVLFARRSFEIAEQSFTQGLADGIAVTSSNRDYIDIPINLKWKINIPVVNNFVRPFLTTGPDFSFLLSKTNAKNALQGAPWKNKTFDTAWNFGLGVELLRHVQVAASYGIGLSKSSTQEYHDALYSGRNRCWTVTASYYF